MKTFIITLMVAAMVAATVPTTVAAYDAATTAYTQRASCIAELVNAGVERSSIATSHDSCHVM